MRGQIDTVLAQGGGFVDGESGAIVPALQMSTTFARDRDYRLIGEHMYRRYSGPTVVQAESVVRDLDGGVSAMLFASGLTAITALLETLGAGDRVVAPTVMYHGAQDWLYRLKSRRGVELTLFDASVPGALAEALAEAATLVWIESPVNPTWDVVDIAAAADLAHSAGALLAVDSTVAPPVTTRPLELGADIVVHSATKYLAGHSDVLGGVLVAREESARWAEVMEVRTLTGGIMSPFDAWLLLRGLRTLAVRFDRCSATALEIAHRFEDHPALEAVLYPGLERHPGHEIARAQMTRGFGGMLSMLVRGDGDRALAIARRFQVFKAATSLGGVESLVEHRATVEGPHSVVPENLLRFSIGLEAPEDLIADLSAALEA